MSVRHCPYCGKSIPAEVLQCPHCGAKLRQYVAEPG
jgi:predicted nucleic acid-binding Zn ribbon protein